MPETLTAPIEANSPFGQPGESVVLTTGDRPNLYNLDNTGERRRLSYAELAVMAYEAQQQIATLEAQVIGLTAERDQLAAELAANNNVIGVLQTQVNDLAGQVVTLENTTTFMPSGLEATDFTEGQEVSLNRDGRLDGGWVVDGFEEKDGINGLILKRTGEYGVQRVWANPDAVSLEAGAPETDMIQEWAPEQEVRTSNNKLRRGWNHLRGKVGNMALRRQVQLHNGVYNYVDRKTGNRQIITEEVVDEYPRSSERAGGWFILGGVALVGAGIIGYYLGKNTGHNPQHEVQETIINNNPGLKTQNHHLHQQVEVLENQLSVKNSAEISESSRRLFDIGFVKPGTLRNYFHGKSGNGAFALDLGQHFKMKENSDGTYRFIHNGKTIIKHLLWDQGGNLGKQLREKLSRAPYHFKLVQDWLTYKDSTDRPGKFDAVKHFVTAIQEKKSV